MVDDPELTKHVPLIQYLGTQGMSSDEFEDAQRRTISYPHIYPHWRSPQLAAILWKANTVSEMIRATPFGHRKKPGTQLHIRPHSHKYNETAPAPVGLPRNCYNPGWLSGLMERPRKVLRVQDQDYPFVTVESGTSHSTTDASQPMEIEVSDRSLNKQVEEPGFGNMD